jgi:hypothetical protein
MVVKVYMFLSLLVLEGAGVAALYSWTATKVGHAPPLAASLTLAPAWVMWVFREWKALKF